MSDTGSAKPAYVRYAHRTYGGLLVGVLLLIGFIAWAVGYKNHPDYRTCQTYFDLRIGHPADDDKFWSTLQQCARDGNLPTGYNDPGYYG